MNGWVRYEGHGNPVCPDCAARYESEDPYWANHSAVYYPAEDPSQGVWDGNTLRECCHSCGALAPR